MKILLALFAITHVFAIPTELARYRSKNRVIVLLSDSVDDKLFKASQVALSKDKERMKERALVVVQESAASGPLHKTFKVEHGFAAILIGKDGGEKWRGNTTLDPQYIFQLIDQMPMRKSEMKSE